MVSATASQAPARRPKERTTQRELERSDYVAGQRKSSCRMMMVRTMSLEFTRSYKGVKSWAREEYSPRGEAGQPSNRLHPGVRKQELPPHFPFPNARRLAWEKSFSLCSNTRVPGIVDIE